MTVETFGTLKDASWNGTNLSTYKFYCVDFLKPLMPEENVALIDIPKKSGLLPVSKKFIKNVIKIIGYIEGISHTDLITNINALAAFLYGDDNKQLILSNEATKYYNAQYKNFEEIVTTGNTAILELVFECYDPFAYAVTATSDDQTITVNDTNKVIANAGHYYALPVITITFNQAQTHIYVENDNIIGNRFDISRTFNSGEVLEVDCKNETIKIDGIDTAIGIGSGGESLAEYLKLAAGNNSITTGSDDATVNYSLNITFNKVYFY